MGLFTGLLTLPLAPARGVAWVAQQLEEQAWEQLYGPDSIRQQLAELEAELDAGNISEAEFEQAEEELLDRLDEVLAARQPEDAAPQPEDAAQQPEDATRRSDDAGRQPGDDP